MESLVAVLFIAALFALGYWLWWVLAKRRVLTLSSRGPEDWRHSRSSHGPEGAGFSVWSYEKGSWVLCEDRSAPGFLPGPAPTRPGTFEEECVRVTSVPAPGGSSR